MVFPFVLSGLPLEPRCPDSRGSTVTFMYVVWLVYKHYIHMYTYAQFRWPSLIQALTYKLDFDEERKDRAEAHSRYAKKVAELKKQHVQEISRITEDLELHKGSLGDVEGVKFALDKELHDWQTEALQSREELQAKTSQVKAYKKQVDQLKKTSEQEKQQVQFLYVHVHVVTNFVCMF